MHILFIHSGQESFVKLDRELLEGFADVQDFHATRKFPRDITRYWHAIRQNDLVFCWFANWNAFWALLLAHLLRKSSVLVIGGYDLANLPEAGYGHQRGGMEKWVSRAAIRLARKLFTNSYYSQKEALINAGVPSQHVKVIYHGVPDGFGSLPTNLRERMALTVGNVEHANLKRKGLEPFVRAASYLPDVQFVVVGTWKDDAVDYLRSIAGANVTFTGRVSDDVLLDYYRRASVYVQASLHEGFGLSVAEAMLGGCIPVVTRLGSLPEVVGDCGVYADSPAPTAVAAAVGLALQAPDDVRQQARDRVLREFTLAQRQASLSDLIIQPIRQ